jgi:hypothetical protein
LLKYPARLGNMAAARGQPRKAVDPRPVSALALLPRFSAALPSTALLGAVDAAGADSFVHRNYTALFATVPVLAVGSLAVFVLRDRYAAAGAASGEASDEALSSEGLSSGASEPLRPDEELALAGIILAAMAERLEHDPAAYPLLACAAARLVPELVGAAGRSGWTGLTERARRAAVEVLRPAALSTLVRAATWGLMPTGEHS